MNLQDLKNGAETLSAEDLAKLLTDHGAIRSPLPTGNPHAPQSWAYSFHHDTLEHIAATMRGFWAELFAAADKHDAMLRTFDYARLADYNIKADPGPEYPFRVQQVTPHTWAVVDGKGRPIIESKNNIINPFTSAADAQAVMACIRQKADNTGWELRAPLDTGSAEAPNPS